MLLYSLIAVALMFSFISLVLLYNSNKKHAKAYLERTQEHKILSEQTDILRSEVNELRIGLLSVGNRVLTIEQQANELLQNQEAQKYEDPDAKIYSRAVKMVELGADLEEVIRECELPRAEAELLMTLHRQKKVE
ncbi:DUF2802 domain-containing protein [Pseudoalteromonas sp. MMG010]|uniref:DUF2802 domain-containing protein n=1 Tax=Pseudoalteromonas sp. MMG010 TaxID=2822685 RepID=UPI001B3A1C5A|nr:DUF2802 domain-containing protein [Pseudoalteromonas sp. MMG010]MBQ4831760.1 DUF2802 domain-containing protein [Pseudoalteromonas sp. MMG010]